MYGIQKIEGQIEQDSTLRREIVAIQEQLHQSHCRLEGVDQAVTYSFEISVRRQFTEPPH